MTMPKHTSQRLTRTAREIMNAIFALANRASAEEIRARPTSPPGDSSVRVMLARLEKKGLLKHQQDGLRYLYRPPFRGLSPSGRRCTVTGRRSLADRCDMMTALVSEGAWSDDDLDALKGEIDRVRKERRPQ